MKTPWFRLMLFSLMTALPSSGQRAEEIEDLYNPDLAPFYHGVASGDPLPDGIILWTRVTQRARNNDPQIRVEWMVADDPGLTKIVAKGHAFATEERDFTVKVDVRGLAAGRTYYYGFKALGRVSITGKTKTAPDTAVDQLKFAVVSCANYEWGYFAGYRKVAERRDLDAVIHVGDYIYEYADNDSYSSEEIRDERVLFPSRETVRLRQYRLRYATYRLDPNLRRAHRQHPFIVIWDDHEFANNAWKRGAENHQRDNEGRWSDRKAAAKRAYFEWMPIREDGEKIYRTLQYGPLMDLILLDTRVQGRDKQIEDASNPRLYDEDRTILGERQKEWLKGKLKASDATWKIIGNQVIFSEFNIGFAADLDPIVSPDLLESLFLDIWDGYPAERRELVRFIKRNKVDNTVILSGDIHASFAFEVADPAFGNENYNRRTGEGAVAVEFVTPSLSAANFNEEIGDFISDELEFEINHRGRDGVNPNPHMKFADLDRHGYMVLTVAADQVQADYYYLRNVLRPRTEESWGGGFTCAAGSNHLVPVDAPASPKAVQDTEAP
jgi:alkaline phosphatase D